MANVFVYAGIAIGSAILGAVLTFTFAQLWDSFITKRRLKKKIPKDEEGKYDTKAMLDGGKPLIDEKEVIEDERDKSRRFRELEKLRAIANERAGKPAKSRTGEISTYEQSAIRRAVQANGDGDVSKDEYNFKLT